MILEGILEEDITKRDINIADHICIVRPDSNADDGCQSGRKNYEEHVG